MSAGRRRRAGREPPAVLARLAQAFQTSEIVPRCASCRRPCCRLETLVLELDWRRLRLLWGLSVSRTAFDAALARGDGPPEIRAQEGLYYAHRRVCPAYDEEGRSCRVYDSSLKPTGCTDFPVYEEDGRLVADLRCAAVDLARLERFLRQAGAGVSAVRVTRDRDFPFLTYCEVLTEQPRPREGRL